MQNRSSQTGLDTQDDNENKNKYIEGELKSITHDLKRSGLVLEVNAIPY